MITPIETLYLPFGRLFVKRDDRFSIDGVCGGKMRTCWHLAQGANGLVTAGSRQSPQANIVATVAHKLGIPCIVHVPQGELSPEVLRAKEKGAHVMQWRAGYNSVIIARARACAKETGYTEIPFGMECEEAVKQTKSQVVNLPQAIKRIVVPVGSGMSLAGILHGLRVAGLQTPVLGVKVGADPTKRLMRFAPLFSLAPLVQAPEDYHCPAQPTDQLESLRNRGVMLDPIYEAKCARYLRQDDLLWIVGIRETGAAAPL